MCSLDPSAFGKGSGQTILFASKTQNTDGVSHVRLTNVKFVALTFFVTKKLATLA